MGTRYTVPKEKKIQRRNAINIFHEYVKPNKMKREKKKTMKMRHMINAKYMQRRHMELKLNVSHDFFSRCLCFTNQYLCIWILALNKLCAPCADTGKSSKKIKSEIEMNILQASI